MSTAKLNTYSALVSSSDPVTGICYVVIPGVLGGSQLQVSIDNLYKSKSGDYLVPAVGERQLVMADEDFSNVFWASTISPLPAEIGGWFIGADDLVGGNVVLEGSGNIYHYDGDGGPGWNDDDSKWWLGADGKFSLGTSLTWDGVDALDVDGSVTARSLLLRNGGFTYVDWSPTDATYGNAFEWFDQNALFPVYVGNNDGVFSIINGQGFGTGSLEILPGNASLIGLSDTGSRAELLVNPGGVAIVGRSGLTPVAGHLSFRAHDFTSKTRDDMIDLYGGSYLIGVESSALRFQSDRYFRFYENTGSGGQIRMDLDAQGGIEIDVGASGSAWGDAALVLLGESTGNIALSFNVGSYAPQIRCGASNNVNFRDSTDTVWATVRAVISDQSDERLKHDIYDFSGDEALDIVRKLDSVSFRWNRGQSADGAPLHVCSDSCRGNETEQCHEYLDWAAGEIGFIAQRVGAVDERLAYRDEGGVFTGLNIAGILSVVTSAVRQLDKQVSSLI